MVNNVVLPLGISILAGLIVWVLQAFFTLTWGLVLVTFIFILCVIVTVYLGYTYIKVRKLGIVRILGCSDKGEGRTRSYMKRANREICFVGIAASKWINEKDIFEKTIRRICALKGGKIRFLLLNPDSEAAKKLSMANGESGNELVVRRKIIASLESIDGLMEKLEKETGVLSFSTSLEIRLYNQMPVFRLTLIDNSIAYFCFYRFRCDGSKLKQLVIKPSKYEGGVFRDNDNNIFNSMSDYFENIWDSPDTITYNDWKSSKKSEEGYHDD